MTFKQFNKQFNLALNQKCLLTYLKNSNLAGGGVKNNEKPNIRCADTIDQNMHCTNLTFILAEQGGFNIWGHPDDSQLILGSNRGDIKNGQRDSVIWYHSKSVRSQIDPDRTLWNI